MQKSQFTFDFSIAILVRFKMPTRWWQMTKIHTFNIPVLNDSDYEAIIGSVDFGETEIYKVNAGFLETSRGRSFFNAYLAELKNLTPPQRAFLKKHSTDTLNYSLDLIIDNTHSHPNPITLSAFEVFTDTKDLLHTASALKNAQFYGKKLVLNDDNNDNFNQACLSFANFWQIENDLVEFRYQDWDAETDEEADKVHIAFFDAKTFVTQFNSTAHNIADTISKIATAMQLSSADLDQFN